MPIPQIYYSTNCILELFSWTNMLTPNQEIQKLERNAYKIGERNAYHIWH
jgi:hypothetical protein